MKICRKIFFLSERMLITSFMQYFHIQMNLFKVKLNCFNTNTKINYQNNI